MGEVFWRWGPSYKVLPSIAIFFCGVPFFIGLVVWLDVEVPCLDNSLRGVAANVMLCCFIFVNGKANVGVVAGSWNE